MGGGNRRGAILEGWEGKVRRRENSMMKGGGRFRRDSKAQLPVGKKVSTKKDEMKKSLIKKEGTKETMRG